MEYNQEIRKIEDFLQSNETYNKVLEILSKYDTNNVLPKIINEGNNFIAGGSVSNILISMIRNNKPVVNDIDVYRVSSDTLNLNQNAWYPSTYLNEEGVELLEDNYGRVYVDENGSRMRVIKHSRESVFNYINYLYYQGSLRTKPKEMVILEGFDLNCCKSGLDLVNKRIIYTEDFVEFLITNHLKVVNPCSPIQTTIRIHKKINDLNCTCDVLHEIRFLTVAFNKIANDHHITKYIGLETYSKYLKMREIVDKYFTLKKCQRDRDLPQSLREKGINLRDTNLWVFKPNLNFDIIDQVYSINHLRRVWELMYRPKNSVEQENINKIYYKNVFLNKKHEDFWEQEVYEFNNDTNPFDNIFGPVTSKKVDSYGSDRYTFQMLLTKRNYHKCDFTLEDVDLIDTTLIDYPHLKMFLSKVDNLAEQLDLVKFLINLTEKEGRWVYGLFRNFRFHRFTSNKLFNYHILYESKTIDKNLILEVVKTEKRFRELCKLNIKLEVQPHRFIRYSKYL